MPNSLRARLNKAKYQGILTDKDMERITISEDKNEEVIDKPEFIRVPKSAPKYKSGDIVAYNINWLREHFDEEREVILAKRMTVKEAVHRLELWRATETMTPDRNEALGMAIDALKENDECADCGSCKYRLGSDNFDKHCCKCVNCDHFEPSWYDIPADEMTKAQLRQAVRDLRQELGMINGERW